MEKLKELPYGRFKRAYYLWRQELPVGVYADLYFEDGHLVLFSNISGLRRYYYMDDAVTRYETHTS